VLGGGTLLAGPASAAPAGSTVSFTSLSVSPSTVTLGNDSAALFSVSVRGSAFATPTGTVRIKADGNRVLCDVTLSGGSGSCRMENTALFPGSHSVVAVYNGDNVFAASQSGPLTLSVNPAVTQPTLTQSKFPVAFGQEQSDTMTVTVGPALPGEFAPSGPFTVVARINGIPTELCSGTLAAGVDAATNTGTCNLSTNTAVPVGEFTIIAHYAGDGTYASGDSVATAIRVTQGQTTTALGLPSASLAFDQENGAAMRFNVGPENASVPPTGQVSVSAVSAATGQASSLCSGALASGAGICNLAAAQLSPGKYLVTATYGGDTNYTGSTSAAQPFTITKVPTRTVLTRTPATIRFGHEQNEHLSVQVTARNGGTPGGRVTVMAGTVKLCTITLKAGKGSCNLTAKKLKAGTYHLVASYPASATFASSASGKVTLTVTK
jgi:hypothetical protein